MVNRTEALHTLGLEEGATPEQVKAAYRECAQILHPDRFAGNKKLQDRATEQFKRLQDAYEVLAGGKYGGSAGSRGSTAAPASSPGAANAAGANAAGAKAAGTDAHARIAGIKAARAQLVAERDSLQDRFRACGGMIVGGLLVAVLLRRLVVVAGIGAAVAVWGLIDAVMLRRNIDVLNKHIARLKKQQEELESQRG